MNILASEKNDRLISLQSEIRKKDSTMAIQELQIQWNRDIATQFGRSEIAAMSELLLYLGGNPNQ